MGADMTLHKIWRTKYRSDVTIKSAEALFFLFYGLQCGKNHGIFKSSERQTTKELKKMNMIEQFAKENGFDVAATKHLLNYIMTCLKEPKHLEAFMSDAGLWTAAAIKSWNDKSKEYCNKYLTDEEFQNQVNEAVFDGLVA